jgi:hypothetical protein
LSETTSFHFTHAVQKYSDELETNRKNRLIWKNTGSMAHTKFAIIKLNTGNLKWACWHIEHAKDLGDAPLYLRDVQWYYRAALIIMDTQKLEPGEGLCDCCWTLDGVWVKMTRLDGGRHYVCGCVGRR